MIALLHPAGALRDAFLAAGLGFLLGLLYRVLRFVVGNSKPACFAADFTLLAAAAVLYRSAAVGSFAAGIMRWYTLLTLLAGYALCQKIFAKPFLQAAASLRFVLFWPFRAAKRYILYPLGNLLRAKAKQTAEKRAKKRMLMRKKRKRDLPKGQQMLYNSQ